MRWAADQAVAHPAEPAEAEVRLEEAADRGAEVRQEEAAVPPGDG
jgi:hypothetical protein